MFKFIAALLIATSIAQADTKLGVMGSILWNTSENDKVDDLAGAEDESLVSFGGGIRALAGLSDQLYLRTGASVIQKKFRYNFDGPLNSGHNEFNFTYISIPATLYIKASPQFGIFGGTALQAKMEDSCQGSQAGVKCRVQNDNSLVLPAILGFDVAFTDFLSIELSYEFGVMETMKDTKVSSAVASLIYNFQ